MEAQPHPENRRPPHSATHALHGHHRLVLSKKVATSRALGLAGRGQPQRGLEMASDAPLLPSRMHRARFPGPQGAGSTWRVSGILCFHLGPSFPVSLAVSVKPSPHARDVFSPNGLLQGTQDTAETARSLPGFLFLNWNSSPFPPCVLHGSLRLITSEILPIKYRKQRAREPSSQFRCQRLRDGNYFSPSLLPGASFSLTAQLGFKIASRSPEPQKEPGPGV